MEIFYVFRSLRFATVLRLQAILLMAGKPPLGHIKPNNVAPCCFFSNRKGFNSRGKITALSIKASMVPIRASRIRQERSLVKKHFQKSRLIKYFSGHMLQIFTKNLAARLSINEQDALNINNLTLLQIQSTVRTFSIPEQFRRVW